MGLAILLQRRHPGVDVVHPELAEAHIAGGALDDLVGQAQVGEDLLRTLQQYGVPAAGLLLVVLADHELLDLLELVHTQQPSDVAAGRADLSAEAWGDAGVEDRQLRLIEDLAGMQADQRDLPGAREEEPVGGQLVGLLTALGEHPGADEGRFLDQRRHRDRPEGALHEQVEGIGVDSTLEQHQVAGQRVGPLAGDVAGPGELRPATLLDQLDMVERLEVERRLLTDRADHDVG